MTKTYSQKLRDPKWQKKRLEVLQRDEFCCQLCNDKETELHIHHILIIVINYIRINGFKHWI